MTNAPSRPISARDNAGPLGRRTVLKGLTGLGVSAATVTVLAGCGGGGGEGAAPQPADAAVTEAVQKAVDAGQVPVGKAAFLEEEQLVVTQPTQGNFYVFSNRCTHQGGAVSQLSEKGDLVCPLHGAQYDPTTGEPVGGPATKGLQQFDVAVS